MAAPPSSSYAIWSRTLPRHRPLRYVLDPQLLVCWLGLCALGLVLIYSTSYYQDDLKYHAARQAAFVLSGLVLQRWVATLPLEGLLSRSRILFALSLLPLVLVPLVGTTVNGARRWLWLGPLGAIQPSEPVKATLLLAQVECLRRRRWDWALGLVVVPFLLVLRQPDLGTVACMAATTWGLLWLAGMDWRWLGGGTAGAMFLLSQGLHDYQKQRLLMFLDPEKDPTGDGWNLIQAKIAMGSGGVQGLGLFQGLQKRLMYVPEQHTDFLFSVLGEEGGFLGCSLLLLLFSLLLARGLRLARRAESPEARWLCGGICWGLAWQTLVNLGMVVGLLPVTGIPLPFLSYGGSAMLTQCALLGLLHGEAHRQRERQLAEGRLVLKPRD